MSNKIKSQFKYSGAGAFALLFLIFSIIQANDLIIRDENGDVTLSISEDGSIGGTSVEPNAETTPASNEDLVIRTDDATENQMIFTESEIKLKGSKVKYDGNDDDIDAGLYFRDSEGEQNKQVQAALTETDANLVYRGNFQYKVKPLDKDPLVPGRTNHPVLFVHGNSLAAHETFSIKPFGFFLQPGKDIECSAEIYEDDLGTHLPIKIGIVNAKLVLYLSTSAGFDFTREETVRLEMYAITENTHPEDVTANVTYDGVEKITYTIYDKYHVLFKSGQATFSLEKYLYDLLENPVHRNRIAFLDDVVGYHEESIPDYLAKKLELNTSFSFENPSEGINSNGLYFFNAKRAIMNGSEVEYWVIDVDVDPDWNVSPENYGQSNQLIDRMIEVLDNHYGEDAWKDNPDAVIDLVGNSQGGLVIRLAAYHSNSTSLDNPINHINRIITTCTPHWGSALSTKYSLLHDIGNEDNDNHKYPVYARERNKLTGRESPGTLAFIENISIPNFMIQPLFSCPVAAARIHNLKIVGESYLGPYQITGKVQVWRPGIIFPWWFQQVLDADLFFTIDPAEESRKELMERQEKGEHLSWRAQQPESIIEKMASDVVYPVRWNTDDPLCVTHLYSPMVEDLLRKSFDRMRDIIGDGLKKGATFGSFAAGTPAVALTLGQAWLGLKDELDDVRNILIDLDNEWCSQADLVVEDFSARGVNVGTGFNPSDPSKDFAVKNFLRPNVTHMNATKLHPDYQWATRQYYDVARELGVFDRDPVPPAPPEVYVPNGTLAQSAFSSSDEIISVSFTNNSDQTLEGFIAEYYVTADSAIEPELTVLISGGISVSMNKCAGNLFRVLFDASGITLAHMETFPGSGPIEFQLSYSTGAPWNHFDDYSYIYSEIETLHDNMMIAVRDNSGEIISGEAPDSAAIERMMRPSCAIFSKERADWDNPAGNTTTQPSLSLENTGSSGISFIHLLYFFKTTSLPVLTVDIQEHAEKATVTLDTLGEDIYAVRVTFSGINLHPGDRIDGINFEISNDDFTLWDYQNDPSFIGSDTLVINSKTLALNDELNRIWGVFPGEIEETYGPFYVWLEACESSEIQQKSRPKIRLLNVGGDTLESFKIYYYFSTEDGRIPVCDVINAPGCAVSVENLSGDQYRVIFECIDVNLEPVKDPDDEEFFPDEEGIIVELYYCDMNDWDRSNDYSADGLDDSWTDTKRIVVEDMNGKVLWGEKP